MPKELTYKQLKKNCDPKSFDFKTTKELDGFNDTIGQKRALKALEFGLRVKTKGFNIFVSGISGIGKTGFVKKVAQKIAETEQIPPDLCYVYNFDDPKFPKKLILPSGFGKIFKDEMADLINYLTDDLPKIFNSKDYEERKLQIIQKYQTKKDKIIQDITLQAQEQNFSVKSKNSGIYFMPMIDGQVISEEQFDSLPQEQKDIITKNSLVMQNHASEIMSELKDYEKSMNKEIDTLDYSIGLFEVGRQMSNLFDKYSAYENVVN